MDEQKQSIELLIRLVRVNMFKEIQNIYVTKNQIRESVNEEREICAKLRIYTGIVTSLSESLGFGEICLQSKIDLIKYKIRETKTTPKLMKVTHRSSRSYPTTQLWVVLIGLLQQKRGIDVEESVS